MYLQEIPENVFTTTLIKIKYDCCQKEHTLKHKDAAKNFEKNGKKHICRPCWLKLNNPAKKQEVKDKMKKTSLERYGTTCALNTAENIAARNEKMFGTEETVREIVTKRRNTSKERYGTDHPMKNEDIKKKQQDVIEEKYGVKVPLQNQEVKEKMQATVKKRYGVSNVMSVPEIRSKMLQTTLERYGVEHYNELPEMKEYLKKNCPEWLKESWENPWAKGITRPEEWNQKQSETMATKIINGEFNPNDKRFFITGWYESPKCKKKKAFFRSGLELMMHHLLDNDVDVEWYENEPFSIKYEKEPGLVRNYIPDFFVYRKSKVPLLAEIKPAFRMREKEVIIKIEAAKEFAKNNGFEFMYVDEKYLRTNSISINEITLSPKVVIHKNQ